MSTQVEKAVYSTNEAIRYLGSREILNTLLSTYPQILSPFRVCKPTGINSKGLPKKGKTEYLKADIDTALKAAKMAKLFIHQER